MSSRQILSITEPNISTNPTELLLTTPPILIKFITKFNLFINLTVILINLFNWQNYYHSLLALTTYALFCLTITFNLKYSLNLIIILILLTHKSSTHKLTPHSYQLTLNNIQLITNTLTQLNSFTQSTLSQFKIQFLITSYPFYLLLTHLIPLNKLFLLIGSSLFLANAPPIKLLLQLLHKSAFIRFILNLLFSLLNGGKGLKDLFKKSNPSLGFLSLFTTTTKPIIVSENNVTTTTLNQPDQDVQIQFTVFENQRWWVGLDWTHALLPGERASWTDPSLNPSLPPASFTLPPPTIVLTPAPTKSSPQSQLKTITEWKWLDSEWIILKSLAPGEDGFPFPATTGQYPLLAPVTDSPPLDPYGPKLTSPITSPTKTRARGTSVGKGEEWSVDVEGWQYGDNHFEKMGAKGGLGKYTRRRAWTRRAGLVERCERVEGEEKEKKEEKKEGAGELKRRDSKASIRRRKSSNAVLEN